jgi:hypothetical protein
MNRFLEHDTMVQHRDKPGIISSLDTPVDNPPSATVPNAHRVESSSHHGMIPTHTPVVGPFQARTLPRTADSSGQGRLSKLHFPTSLG